jgi:hypothetical protein
MFYSGKEKYYVIETQPIDRNLSATEGRIISSTVILNISKRWSLSLILLSNKI